MNKSKISRLQLDEFFVKRMNLKWVPGESEEGDEERPIDLDYEVARHDEKDRLFRLVLRVVLPVLEGRSGLDADLEIAGFFSFPEDVDEDEMQYLVRVNGATILYGILRGQVAMATGSFPGGKFNLPAVVMQEVLPEIDRAKAENETDEIAEDPTEYDAGDC